MFPRTKLPLQFKENNHRSYVLYVDGTPMFDDDDYEYGNDLFHDLEYQSAPNENNGHGFSDVLGIETG